MYIMNIFHVKINNFGKNLIFSVFHDSFQIIANIADLVVKLSYRYVLLKLHAFSQKSGAKDTLSAHKVSITKIHESLENLFPT